LDRFKVRKIVKTLPYIVAEVEPNLADNEPADKAAASELELEVYSALKYYIRLMKSYGPNKDMVVSKATKATRPLRTNESKNDSKRRTEFSFALANMIQVCQFRSHLKLSSQINHSNHYLDDASKGISTFTANN
jgi:phage/plasmid-associated DNA primase